VGRVTWADFTFMQSCYTGFWGHGWSLSVEEHFYIVLLVLLVLSPLLFPGSEFRWIPLYSAGRSSTLPGDKDGCWSGATTRRVIDPTQKKQHSKALRLSNVRPFVLYSLRHTFLTRLGESGCDAWTLARIAGDSSLTNVLTVCHPSEDSVFAVMEALGGHKIGHIEKIESNGRSAAQLSA
jgi:integrase